MKRHPLVSRETTLTVLGEILSEESTSRVVAEVVEAGRDKDSPVHWFRKTLSGSIKGFRKSSPAIPDALIVSAGLNLIKTKEQVLLDAMVCWCRIRVAQFGELRKIMRRDKELLERYVDFRANGATWDSAEILSLAEDMGALFATVSNHMERDEARLIAGCILLIIQARHVPEGLEEATETEELGEAGEPSNALVAWLPVLEALEQRSPDDPIWGSVDDFVAATRRIAAEKISSRTPLFKKRLKKGLVRLKEHHQESLMACNAGSALDWSVIGFVDDDLPIVVEKVEGLDRLLAEWEVLRGKTWSTSDERKSLNDALDNTETGIKKACAAVGSLLVPGTQPTAEDSNTASTDDIGKGRPEMPRSTRDEDVGSTPASETGNCPETEIESAVDEAQVDEVSKEACRPTVRTTPSDSGATGERQQEVSGRDTEQADKEVTKAQVDQPKLAEATEPDPSADLLWNLVDKHDISGAYWLARGLELSGKSPALPSDLLAALQMSEWLDPSELKFIEDLRDIAGRGIELDGPERRLLSTAASLIPAVLVPETGMSGWLDAPAGFSILYQLTEIVTKFAQAGVGFRPEDLQGAAGQERRQQQIARVVQEAQRRLKSVAGDQVSKYVKANEVWHVMFAKDSDTGVLKDVLSIVASDRRDRIEELRVQIANLSGRETVVGQVRTIERHLHRRKSQQLIGIPLEQVIRAFSEVLDLAESWCDLVSRDAQYGEAGEWLVQRALQFRRDAAPLLKELLGSLAEQQAHSAPLAVAARCLSTTIQRLSCLLELEEEQGSSVTLGVSNSWWTGRSQSLEEALGRRLLWLPDLSMFVDDRGLLLPDEGDELPQLLVQSMVESPSLDDALERWSELGDYRFADVLLEAAGDDSEQAALTRLYHSSVGEAQVRLSNRIAEIDAAIEHAFLNGVLDEVQRADYSGRTGGARIEDNRNFHPVFQELDNIESELRSAVSLRSASLRKDWSVLETKLKAQTDGDKYEAIGTFLENAFARGDVRIIHEKLAQIHGFLEKGEDLPTLDPRAIPIEEYLSKAEKLRTVIREDPSLARTTQAIRTGQSVGGIAFGQLPPAHLEQAAKALQSWRKLKQTAPELRRKGVPQLVIPLLTFLSFTMRPVRGESVEVVEYKADWLHGRAHMSARDLARPFPQYGSMTHERYDFLVVWEKQEADTLIALLRDRGLDKREALVIYLGSLSDFQRKDLMRVCRREAISVAVLDEPLVLFLAGQRRARLPQFLACALPYSATVPYTPDLRGYVPPEIFVGRDDLEADLADPAGTCLVYGGRQMGKSALLQHVVKFSHNPEEERFASFFDIGLVGSPGSEQGPDEIWRLLRDELIRTKLIARSTARSQDSIVKLISSAFRENPRLRVLAMFDEADQFLNSDSRNQFRVVTGLRTLMTESGRRFKAVFAGVHHVKRFHGMPNQPLAHFGDPVLVGPLEAQAAERLVREPLEALGFEIDPAVALHILSYTNYHPGLIQYFCQQLLFRLYGPSQSLQVPSRVVATDVDAVYLKEDVRTRIFERFDWTLALDRRYKAIIWSMVVEQMSTDADYSRAYDPGELYDLGLYWWSQGLGSVGMDEFRSLLDELCGLGILVRTVDGQYRLRSPSVVRVLGTEKNIQSRLEELSESPYDASDDPDSHHAPLDQEARKFSPLTLAQARLLNSSPSGVTLVFGTPALGIETIEQVLTGMLSAEALAEDPNAVRSIAARCKAPEIRNALVSLTKKHSIDRSGAALTKVIAYQSADVDAAEDLQSRLEVALESCRNLSNRHVQLRVFYLINGAAWWVWLGMPESVRTRLENRVGCVISLKRWDCLGLRQRLDLTGKISTDEACEELMSSLGGWHLLIEEMMAQVGDDADPRTACAEMRRQLLDTDSGLYRRFRDALAFDGNSAARDVYAAIAAQEPIPLELYTPEMLFPESRDITQDHLDQTLDYLAGLGLVDPRTDPGVVTESVSRFALLGNQG